MEFSSAIRVFSLFQGDVSGAGYIAAYVTLISEYWVWKDVGRGGRGVIWITIPAFLCKYWLKPHGALMKEASLQVAIWIWGFQNIKR